MTGNNIRYDQANPVKLTKDKKRLRMKTWIDKRDCEKSFKIKTIDKKFADIRNLVKMFIATTIIDDYG